MLLASSVREQFAQRRTQPRELHEAPLPTQREGRSEEHLNGSDKLLSDPRLSDNHKKHCYKMMTKSGVSRQDMSAVHCNTHILFGESRQENMLKKVFPQETWDELNQVRHAIHQMRCLLGLPSRPFQSKQKGE